MKTIGQYSIEDQPFAKGPNTALYNGRDSKGARVVVKAVTGDKNVIEAAKERVKRSIEVQKSGYSLTARIHTAFEDNGVLYVVMQPLDGMNLEEYIANYGALTVPAACDLMMKIIKALGPLHAKNIVHRDLEPSHVIIGANGAVSLIGFDTAAATTPNTGYKSPEQTDGLAADQRADIYSLGCLMYYLLTGRHAFRASAAETGNSKTQILPEAAGMPDDVREVLEKATDKNMTRRFQTCGQFMEALHELSRPAASAPEEAEAAPKKSRKGLIITLVTVLVVVMLGAGAYMYWQMQDEPEDTGLVLNEEDVDSRDTTTNVVPKVNNSHLKGMHKKQQAQTAPKAKPQKATGKLNEKQQKAVDRVVTGPCPKPTQPKTDDVQKRQSEPQPKPKPEIPRPKNQGDEL